MKHEKHPLELDPPKQVIMLSKTGWHIVDLKGELPQSTDRSTIRSYEYEGHDLTGKLMSKIMVILTMHVDVHGEIAGSSDAPS